MTQPFGINAWAEAEVTRAEDKTEDNTDSEEKNT